MDILFLCLAFLAGWWLCKILTLRKILNDPDDFVALIKRYKQIKEEDEDSSGEGTRNIRIEKHGSVLYLYASDTEEFLAQGANLQEALEIVQKRFPGQNFKGLLSKEEAENLGISAK